MSKRFTEMVGNDGARMGRDENGSYMIAANGASMRMGPKEMVMVAADGATLRKPRRGPER